MSCACPPRPQRVIAIPAVRAGDGQTRTWTLDPGPEAQPIGSGWWVYLWAELVAGQTATVQITGRDGIPVGGRAVVRTFGTADLPNQQAIKVWVPYRALSISIVVAGGASDGVLVVSGVESPCAGKVGRYLYRTDRAQAAVAPGTATFTAPSGADAYRVRLNAISGATQTFNIAELDGTTVQSIGVNTGIGAVAPAQVSNDWRPITDRVSSVRLDNKEAALTIDASCDWRIDLWR